MGVDTILIARTDADAADMVTSDIDPRDAEFITGERTPEGFFRTKAGIKQAIARGLAYAPYADLIWCETSKPSLEEAREFAEAIHAEFPVKCLHTTAHLHSTGRQIFQKKKSQSINVNLVLGYKFQLRYFSSFHALNHSMFELAHDYKDNGMSAYSKLQQAEFASESKGYTATRHQREVGTGYFDEISSYLWWYFYNSNGRFY